LTITFDAQPQVLQKKHLFVWICMSMLLGKEQQALDWTSTSTPTTPRQAPRPHAAAASRCRSATAALGPEVEVGVLAARPTGFDAQRWWTNRMGAKSTLGGALSLGWTRCCFRPGASGSHDELWGVPVAPK
jgi:hypothetical protein